MPMKFLPRASNNFSVHENFSPRKIPSIQYVIQELCTYLGRGWLSVVCTPTTLGSTNSSPTDLSAKLCSRSVRLSVLKLGLNCITQWLISYVIQELCTYLGCGWLSVVCTPTTLVIINFSPSDLSAKLRSRSVHQLVRELGLNCILNELRYNTVVYLHNFLGHGWLSD